MARRWLRGLAGLFCRGVRCVVVGWAIACMCLLGALPAWAQDPLPPESAVEQLVPMRSILSADDIASEKVSQFVQAYLGVLQLVEQREGELQRAETEPEFLGIQQNIETSAFAIIQQAGLTPQEYLQLLGLANTDPEFGERVATLLQEQ